jgi:hypothetical protein
MSRFILQEPKMYLHLQRMPKHIRNKNTMQDNFKINIYTIYNNQRKRQTLVQLYRYDKTTMHTRIRKI